MGLGPGQRLRVLGRKDFSKKLAHSWPFSLARFRTSFYKFFLLKIKFWFFQKLINQKLIYVCENLML